MQLADLAKELGNVCGESVQLSVEVWLYQGSKEPTASFRVYVANKVNKSFTTYSELEKFITLLLMELKKIDVKATENSVERAFQLMKTEGTVVL